MSNTSTHQNLDTNTTPETTFCILLQEWLRQTAQSFGKQFPALKQNIRWLGVKMRKNKHAHVCRKMFPTMRPILTRMKQPNGDETLIDYARENRVELFEMICLVQVYPSLLDEEKRALWLTLGELAKSVGMAKASQSKSIGSVLQRAAQLPLDVNVNQMNPLEMSGQLIQKMLANTQLIQDLGSSMQNMLQDENPSNDIMDLLENTGIISYEQRMRAEEKARAKVTIHTSQNDDSDGDALNDAAREMFMKHKQQRSDRTIEDVIQSLSITEEETKRIQEDQKQPREFGDVLSDIMVQVPIRNGSMKDAENIIRNLVSDDHLRSELGNAAGMFMKGDMKNIGTQLRAVTSIIQSQEPQEKMNEFQQFCDIECENDLLSTVFTQLKDIPSFEA